MVAVAEWLNAADCGFAKEKSFTMSSNLISHPYAGISQLEEEADSNPVKCEFESHYLYVSPISSMDRT